MSAARQASPLRRPGQGSRPGARWPALRSRCAAVRVFFLGGGVRAGGGGDARYPTELRVTAGRSGLSGASVAGPAGPADAGLRVLATLRAEGRPGTRWGHGGDTGCSSFLRQFPRLLALKGHSWAVSPCKALNTPVGKLRLEEAPAGGGVACHLCSRPWLCLLPPHTCQAAKAEGTQGTPGGEGRPLQAWGRVLLGDTGGSEGGATVQPGFPPRGAGVLSADRQYLWKNSLPIVS